MSASVKLSDSERLAVNYVVTKNYMVQQQALLIALLNQNYTITLKMPRKRSEKTENLMRILMVSDGIQELEFTNVVEKICRTKMAFDRSKGVSEKTSYRRFTYNKVIEAHHLLMDLVGLDGILFDSYYSSGKNQSNRTETIIGILRSVGQIWFNESDISILGTRISEWLYSQLETQETLVLQKEDMHICSLLSK
ncbi:hypothetical protein EIN_084330 [Entamoeba invadens IP1]|uniref:hypothetical protein n=1 Tax=Entamoeba invadens IP1 TaxID=370355 RepID=UPI0002C3E54E|nr:hypothetical protein EIN_084330 [Entamoeba invadens IP1]ELP85261.1 hypothetical protein EIN_084330 [Entamoeba invadens IP1]|eukprot:XP_004184607.1 hypothetical protein EIN_084330 [Entamoeba invadens IP1]